MKQGAYIERYADLTALLVKAPRTLAELMRLTELSEAPATRFLHALEAEGLIHKAQVKKTLALRGRRAFLWTWQP